DYYGYDDGLYAAVRLLSILQKSGDSLAGFRDALPPVVNTPEIRVPCPDDRKWAVVEEVRARQLALGKETSAVDGVRVQEAGGWWLLRASNTQDILVVRCEAQSPHDLEAITECVRRELAAAQILLPASSG
ncbi:MAG TPA: phosphomannomutase, partial [Kiloniellaceae bacterium]